LCDGYSLATRTLQTTDFAIDCNTWRRSKGATRCGATPIEFLSSCVQLVYSWHWSILIP